MHYSPEEARERQTLQEKLLQAPAYRLAHEDPEELNRPEMRPVRL